MWFPPSCFPTVWTPLYFPLPGNQLIALLGAAPKSAPSEGQPAFLHISGLGYSFMFLASTDSGTLAPKAFQKISLQANVSFYQKNLPNIFFAKNRILHGNSANIQHVVFFTAKNTFPCSLQKKQDFFKSLSLKTAHSAISFPALPDNLAISFLITALY